MLTRLEEWIGNLFLDQHIKISEFVTAMDYIILVDPSESSTLSSRFFILAIAF